MIDEHMHGFLYRFFGVSLTSSNKVYNQFVDELSEGGIKEMNEFIAKIHPPLHQKYIKKVKKNLILCIINAQQNAELNKEKNLKVGECSGPNGPFEDSIDYNLNLRDRNYRPTMKHCTRCELIVKFSNKLYDVLGNGKRQMNFVYEPSCRIPNNGMIISYSIIGKPVE